MNLRLGDTPALHLHMTDDSGAIRRSVLVVDDDAPVRETFAAQLRIDGWHVASAANVAAAQAALRADPTISVLVCDINLAGESGFDLAGALAQLRPERLATEIVFITGNACSETAIDALRHRAFDLIRKPVRRAELIARVSEAHLSAVRRRQRQGMLDQVETRMAEGESLKHRLAEALHDAEGQNRAFEQDAGAARHDLLAVISHELKTPLIPIVGLSDIMLAATDLSPEEVREYAVLIREGGEQLEAIIDRTLAYLDTERQHALGDKGDFAVDDLISAALDLRAAPGAARKPEIVVACPLGLRARGVRALLAQALGELVDNAIKASPTDATVRIEAGVLAGGRVSVEVTDSGPGIPDTVQRNLGVPFLQGDCGLARRWSGVGLGLARAKKIARLSGGGVDICAPPCEGGARLRLTLRGKAA